MSTPLIDWAFSQRIAPGPKFVLLALASCKDPAFGYSGPTRASIEKLCNLDSATVGQHLQFLTKAGLIDVRGRGDSVVYELKTDRDCNHPGHVYFIRNRMNGLIKIGFSQTPERRLARMRMGGDDLELLATMPGAFSDEKRLHKQFASLWVTGEWFRAEPELSALIASLSDSSKQQG